MRPLLLATVALLPCAAVALAAPAPAPQAPGLTATGDASATVSSAVDPTTKRSTAARAADVVNVMDSHGGVAGAKGDDIADDAAAINAAITYARTLSSGTNGPYVQTAGPYARLVFPSGHRWRIASSGINLSGIVGNGIDVDMEGSAVDCHVAGGICVDALGSNELRFHSVSIVGDPTDMPKIGLQIGRNSTFVTADNHDFDKLHIVGQFQFSGLYDLAAETTTFEHPEIWNYSGIAGSYAAVFDDFNHAFTYYPNGLTGTPVTSTVSSAFISTANAQTETASSFNETTIYGGDIRANVGYGVPLWLGGTSRFAMDKGSYVAGGGTGCGSYCYGAVIHTEGGTPNRMPWIDAHFEDLNLTDIFYFDGDNTGTMFGFHYAEQGPQASNSIIKAAPNVTYYELRDADFQIGSFAVAGTKLFDNPAIWTASGRYSSQSFSGFNAANWSGKITIATQDYPLATYGAAPIQAQVTDSTVTGGNTRGQYATDLQRERSTASQVAGGVGSFAGGVYNTAGGNYSAAFGYGTGAQGQDSFAVGGSTGASGIGSFVAGLGSHASGVGSAVVGAQGDDHGNNGSLVISGGQFATGGDAQVVRHVMSGTGSGSSAIRLTAGAGSVGPTTCLALPNSFSAALTIHLHATDKTTRGADYDWLLPQAMLTVDGGAATAAYAAGPTAPSVLSRGTVTGAGVTVAADTTNGCLNLSFTPPSANTTDVWDAVARIDAVEEQ